jgi:hypothetical protein
VSTAIALGVLGRGDPGANGNSMNPVSSTVSQYVSEKMMINSLLGPQSSVLRLQLQPAGATYAAQQQLSGVAAEFAVAAAIVKSNRRLFQGHCDLAHELAAAHHQHLLDGAPGGGQSVPEHFKDAGDASPRVRRRQSGGSMAALQNGHDPHDEQQCEQVEAAADARQSSSFDVDELLSWSKHNLDC